MALSADRNTPFLGAGGVPIVTNYPVAATTTIYKGSLVCIDSSGNLNPAADSAGFTCVGMALEHIDNSSGAAGDLFCQVQQGVARWGNTSGLTKSSVGSLVYCNDDASVKSTGTAIAGTVYLVDSTGIWVYSGLNGPLDAAALTTFIANLASTANGEGASLVGIEDAGAHFTAAEVEAALLELVLKANAGLQAPASMAVVLSAAVTGATLATFTAKVSGKISGLGASPYVIASTASKSCNIRCYISSVATSGGLLNLTTSNMATLGSGVSSASMSGVNAFSPGQIITVVAESTASPFSEGAANVWVFFASA